MKYNPIDLSWGDMGQPTIALLSTISGISFTLFCSTIINHFSLKLTCFFSYVGKHTLSVLIGHIPAFKLVVIFQVLVFHSSIDNLLSHPSYINTGFWPIVYLLFGIGIPLIIMNFKHHLATR